MQLYAIKEDNNMADKIKRFLGNPVNEGDKVLSRDYEKWLKAVSRLCDKVWSKRHMELSDILNKSGKLYWSFITDPHQDKISYTS